MKKKGPLALSQRKPALDFTGFHGIGLNASGAIGTLWGLFSPKPRTRVIDPGPSCGRSRISLQTSFPLKRQECVDSHRPGGRMPPAGCDASGKTKKTPEEKACFLSRRFCVFIAPVAKKHRFLMFHAEVRLQNLPTRSQAGVQRRNSSGAGFRGRAGPCSIPLPPQIHWESGW